MNDLLAALQSEMQAMRLSYQELVVSAEAKEENLSTEINSLRNELKESQSKDPLDETVTGDVAITEDDYNTV